MGDIQYLEKPDWISWSEVCNCIHAACAVNDKNGFHMHFSDIKPEELENELRDGKCFVALHNKNVVGTASYKIRKLRKWYVWGNVIYHCNDGILPSYRGTDVYFGLKELRKNEEKNTGIRIFQFHTAEKNKTVIKINLRYGYKLVLFRPNKKGSNYYSVTMVKWEDGCPWPDWFLNFMFKVSRTFFKTFFTPDFKLKFWPRKI